MGLNGSPGVKWVTHFFSKNLRKILAISIIKESLVCLVVDEKINSAETTTRAE